MSFDMYKMLAEAQRMQEELAKAQEEAASEVVEASAGGGMVTVKANGAGEVVSITIDSRAIDTDDPELLAEYHDAVHEQTLAYLDTLEDADLARVVDEDWDPPVTLAVRLVSVIDDDTQHAGQAAFSAGLAERAGL